MIRIWKLKVKVKNDRKPIRTIGWEEESHNLIVWKPWVDFHKEFGFDYFHQMNLKNDYCFMQMLLKIGTYSVCMKKEDRVQLYSANISGISPYMLRVIAKLDPYTVTDKLKRLDEIGYVGYIESTVGRFAECNILLNEFTKDNLRIFKIEKDWLSTNLIVDKVQVYAESEDQKNYKIINPFDEWAQVKVGDIPQEHTPAQQGDIPQVHTGEHREVPIVHTVNVVNDRIELDGIEVDLDDTLWTADGLEGDLKGLVLLARSFRDGTGGVGGVSTQSPVLESKTGDKDPGSVYLRKQGSAQGFAQETDFSNRVDIKTLPTWEKVLALFYEQETGLYITQNDVPFLKELLKISGMSQIASAIKSAKIWRATLPPDFEKLSDPEKKRCVIESQPGFFLKKLGLKHVYNFVSNSPRFRKDRHAYKHEVKSGLDEERAREQQRKIMAEIRKKRYGTADGKQNDGK